MFGIPSIYLQVLAIAVILFIAYLIEGFKFRRLEKQLSGIKKHLENIHSIQFDLAGQITGELPKGPRT